MGLLNLSDDTLHRFWDKVDIQGTDDCWNWTAGCNTDGYGNFALVATVVGFKLIGAHRLAYQLKFGAISPELKVLHSCDNPKCVNYKHLSLGTDLDNSKDKMAKGRGRHAKGSAHGRTQLTDDDVRTIRAIYAGGTTTQKAIASLYGLTQTQVSKIVLRQSWTHI